MIKRTVKMAGTIFLSGILCQTVYAADNSIYIDQAGNYATINVLQDGSGNVVKGIVSGQPGTSTDPAKMNGDNIGIDIKQTGAGNVLSMGVNTSSPTPTSASSIKYDVSGGSNIGYIDLNNNGASGGNVSSTVDITQTGGGNNARLEMMGARNYLKSTQSDGSAVLNSTVNANDTTQNITTSGGTGNSVTTNLTSDGGLVDVKIAGGGSNLVSITQSGSALNSVYLDINGIGNNFTSSQSSTVNSMINVKSTGNNNTYSIIQR
jgi:hypothetical protein